MRDPHLKDVLWFRPDGAEMAKEDWDNPIVKSLGMLLAGDAINERDEHGVAIADDTMLLLINAHYEPLPFTMPPFRFEGQWELVMDTRTHSARRYRHPTLSPGEEYELEARSLALFSFPGASDEEE